MEWVKPQTHKILCQIFGHVQNIACLLFNTKNAVACERHQRGCFGVGSGVSRGVDTPNVFYTNLYEIFLLFENFFRLLTFSLLGLCTYSSRSILLVISVPVTLTHQLHTSPTVCENGVVSKRSVVVNELLLHCNSPTDDDGTVVCV